MAARDFKALLEAQWERGRMLCVGLDPEMSKLPEAARRDTVRETIVAFNTAIIGATKTIAGSYKPNSAFYEAHGEEGFAALRETIAYIHATVPEASVILDCKRADIGSTNEGYARMAFEHFNADAITVHPYLGADALAPFLSYADKGIFVLARTSNPGAGELQDLLVDGEPLYAHVARAVAMRWNRNGNCGLVVGATYPEEAALVRRIAPDLPFLVPGIGAQGGDIATIVRAARDTRGKGMLVAASRAIIFASLGPDFAEAAHAAAQQLDGAIMAAALE